MEVKILVAVAIVIVIQLAAISISTNNRLWELRRLLEAIRDRVNER